MADGTSPIVLLSGYANGPGLAHLVLTLRWIMEKTGRTTGPWICASHSFLSRGRLDAQVCSWWASAERGLVVFEFEGPPLYFEISSYRSVMMIHKAAILFFSVEPIVTEKVMPQTDHQLQRFRGYAHTNENSLSISWPLNLNLFFMNIFCFFLFLPKCRMGRRKGKTKGIIHSNKW